MVRRDTLGWILLVGFMTELIVFLLAIHLIGFGPAVLLSLATSLLGVARLRHVGRAALASLLEFSATPRLRQGDFVDGILQALGAGLLILPGFISDFAGLVLTAPSGRRWIGHRLRLVEDPRPRRDGHAAPTIELGAEDWTRIDNVRHG
jgi:UPF0716 protein FxsA